MSIIGKYIKYIYTLVSVIAVVLICFLVVCGGGLDEYQHFFDNRCNAGLTISIICLFGLNIIMVIVYNIYNKFCAKNRDDIDGFTTLI